MIFLYFFDSTGFCTSLRECDSETVANQLLETVDHTAWAISDIRFDIKKVYCDSFSNLVSMSERPTQYHLFNYTNKNWEDTRTNETEWARVRSQRFKLLAETDWVTVKSFETGNPIPTQWLTYRQALRDITNQTDPFNIVWPLLPQ